VPEFEQKSKISYSPSLSLAMYKELAVHLSQVGQITTELIWQESLKFNYTDSQISGMWLSYPRALSQSLCKLIQEILSHYGNWVAEPKLFERDFPDLLVSSWSEGNLKSHQ
jgi:hypothetical protein